MTQDFSKQETGPARRIDSTRKVVTILGVALLVVGGIAVALATGTGRTRSDPQPAGGGAIGAGPNGTNLQGATAAAIGPSAPVPTATGTSPRDIAGARRRDATLACHAAQWAKCKADLDEAAQLDPPGDSIPQVRHMREMADKAGN